MCARQKISWFWHYRAHSKRGPAKSPSAARYPLDASGHERGSALVERTTWVPTIRVILALAWQATARVGTIALMIPDFIGT